MNSPEKPQPSDAGPETASDTCSGPASVGARDESRSLSGDAGARDGLPPLGRDPAFLGMTATQFLGAFNDNLYKQLLLLIALDYKRLNNWESDPWQPVATLVFTVPFILLSGFGGYLSDKIRKRNVIIFCKVLEILVMTGAMVAFLTGTIGTPTLMISLLVVLMFMASQSAIFGPSKYGVLPEMFRESDLPRANGIIQMTTFLAVIFGTAVCGLLKDAFPDHLWAISGICILIAIAGTLTALLVRRTPVANPDMKLTADCLVVEKSTFRVIVQDRMLVQTLLVYALFWFGGAVMLLAINIVAKDQLGFSDARTSLAQAFIGTGIALGCVVCGRWSRERVRFDLVRAGGWGLLVSTALASVICIAPFGNETTRFWLMCGSLAAVGFFAGVYAVPPQVFIQARPPASKKGRVVGAMNLLNWICIAFASGWYFLLTLLLGTLGWPSSWIFLSIGLLFLVTIVLFRQPNPPVQTPNPGQ